MKWQFELLALATIATLVGICVLVLIQLLVDWIKSLIYRKIKIDKNLFKRRL